MKPNLEELNKAASTNGLIIGIISTAIGIVLYYVAPSSMGSLSVGMGISFLMLVLYIIFTIDLRKKIGKYWSFKEALKGIFLMAFVAGILNITANFIFYKFIEPGAYEKISGYVTDGLTQTYERFGMNQDRIDEAVEMQLKGLKSQFSPGPLDLLRNLGISILFQFILSLIFAAIFKKEPPVFAQTPEE